MPECGTPLWPCAMTGAAACLAGFDGIKVIIHGSSGCYYYPATLLHTPLYGTFILENEVIFGSGDRLREVIAELSGTGKKIAVINTCVPSLLGEDLREMIDTDDFILVDSPGYSGRIEDGYKAALSSLRPDVDPNRPGVNIDGVSLSDPFSSGNIQEVTRILHTAGIPTGTILCRDTAEMAGHASFLTITTNRDFGSGVGTCLGGTLGFSALRATCARLAAECDGADLAPALAEFDRQEERIISACDKFLRRFNPPEVAVFGGISYGLFAAETLERYLDAEILIVGTRNALPEGTLCHWPVEHLTRIEEVRTQLAKSVPDLIIGSSFERSICPDAAFVGIIPPLRGRIRLAPAPLAGSHGTLYFVEEVLNACMDSRK